MAQTIEDYRTQLAEGEGGRELHELHELCEHVIDRLEEAQNNEPWLTPTLFHSSYAPESVQKTFF